MRSLFIFFALIVPSFSFAMDEARPHQGKFSDLSRLEGRSLSEIANTHNEVLKAFYSALLDAKNKYNKRHVKSIETLFGLTMKISLILLHLGYKEEARLSLAELLGTNCEIRQRLLIESMNSFEEYIGNSEHVKQQENSIGLYYQLHENLIDVWEGIKLGATQHSDNIADLMANYFGGYDEPVSTVSAPAGGLVDRRKLSSPFRGLIDFRAKK